jgi:hypothetical protein
MPRNEGPRQPGEGGRDKDKDQEQQPAYLDVRRFPSVETAARAYQEGQQALQRDLGANDVSIYRIQVGPELVPHVVALGDSPEPALGETLEGAFALGERVTLDADIVAYLVGRREAARGLGPWVEAHHRPGQPVWLETRRRQTEPGQQRQPGQSERPQRREKPKKHPGRSRRGSWKKNRH